MSEQEPSSVAPAAAGSLTLGADALRRLDRRETCTLSAAQRERLAQTLMTSSERRLDVMLHCTGPSLSEALPQTTDDLAIFLATPGIFLHVQESGQGASPSIEPARMRLSFAAKVLLIASLMGRRHPFLFVHWLMATAIVVPLFFGLEDARVLLAVQISLPVSLAVMVTGVLTLMGKSDVAARYALAHTALGNWLLMRYPGAADTPNSMVLAL